MTAILTCVPFVSRALLAATFTGVRTPAVKALGVLELWFLYQARRADVVELAVPALRRGWSVPRSALAAGMFRPTTTEAGLFIAPGPRRARLLLPSKDGTPGLVALYTPRERLLDAICDTAAVTPFETTDTRAEATAGRVAGWSA